MNHPHFHYTGSVTAAAREQLASFLRAGDWVVDATAGRGHDCVELAAAVGPAGRVIGVDIQESAVESASVRMAEQHLAQVDVLRGCHSDWSALLPPEWKGQVKAFVYNLGYLPGGDHSLTTGTGTTLQSIQEAFQWLSPDGVMRIVAYRGHPGGEEEYQAVRALLPKLARTAEFHSPTAGEPPPVIFLLTL